MSSKGSATGGSSGGDSAANVSTEAARSANFVQQFIGEDLRSGKYEGRVHTRFPPEPNGRLHIGHAKAICLNFGMAEAFEGGQCNLRFDDTNPVKEDVSFVEAIKRDIRWLGFDWEDREYYASDYFEQLYEYAIRLIKKGRAFVCDLTQEQIREYRGVPTEAGQESPFRDRSIEENLDLFRRMRAGEFPDGARVLRAKIDMASPNLHMRDPVLYRILSVHHHRTGDQWCIYPMYDFAHGQSDSIEGITHSLCSLEFENHRPLYDWLLDALGIYHPRQIEFARLNLSHTVMSKRKLSELVENHHVSGWDDPRMPTLSGYRRRGYTPESIRDFCDRIGVAKVNGVVDVALLESCIREDLNYRARRVMAVQRPLKVVIDNYPDDLVEEMEALNHPGRPELGSRKVPFSKEIYIEETDFLEDPPRKFHRLGLGREVRLRYAYLVTCTGVVKDDQGQITEVHCTYDPATRGGNAPDGRKVKGTIHWVSARHAVDAEIRLYDHLFTVSDPLDVADGEHFTDNLNPESLRLLKSCKLEPILAEARVGELLQFERQGYYCVDSKDSKEGALVFNRTVSLRDTWAKVSARAK